MSGAVAASAEPGPGGASGRQLGGDAVLLSVGKIAALLGTLLLFVLLSRTLPPAEYGTFRQVWLINKGAVEVFALGLPISVLYYLGRLEDGQKKAFILQSVLLLAGAAVLVAAAIFLFADAIARGFDNPRLASLLRLFCAYPVLVAPSLAVEGALVASRRVFGYAAFAVLSRVGVFAAGLAAVAAGWSLEGVFALILVAGVAELAAAGYLLRRESAFFQKRGWPGQLHARPGRLEQVGLALPTGASNLLGYVNQEVDKLVIAVSFSAAGFARYANGSMEIPIIGTIVGSVSAVLMPEVARRFHDGDRSGVLALWHGAVGRVALLLFPALVFFGVFAPEFMVLLFSETYRDSAVIFQIYLLATLPKLTWYGPFLVAVGRTRAPLYGALIALLSNLVLNLLLLRWIGFVGPAIATALTSCGLAAFYLSRIRSVFDVGWATVFPWARLAGTLALAGLAGSWLPLLRLTPVPAAAYLAFALTAYPAVVLACFRAAGLLGASEIRLAMAHLGLRRPAAAATGDEAAPAQRATAERPGADAR